MTKAPDRVVFDCNVFFQAFISESGPAGRLLQAVDEKRITLYISEYVLLELRDVLSRPRLVSQFGFTSERVAEYLKSVEEMALTIAAVPHVFDFPRDPKDAHYVDLAVAADAKLIVSRDKDLLSLRDSSTADGQDFRARFPTIEILTPPEALQSIEADGSA